MLVRSCFAMLLLLGVYGCSSGGEASPPTVAGGDAGVEASTDGAVGGPLAIARLDPSTTTLTGGGFSKAGETSEIEIVARLTGEAAATAEGELLDESGRVLATFARTEPTVYRVTLSYAAANAVSPITFGDEEVLSGRDFPGLRRPLVARFRAGTTEVVSGRLTVEINCRLTDRMFSGACAGECISQRDDAAHCQTCNHACGAAQTCIPGVGGSTCEPFTRFNALRVSECINWRFVSPTGDCASICAAGGFTCKSAKPFLDGSCADWDESVWPCDAKLRPATTPKYQSFACLCE